MFFEFIKNHYELIGSILLVLISFVLTLVKKKPVLNKIDEVYNYILRVLPELIVSVEKPGNGISKKDLVMKEVKLLIAREFSFYDWEHIKNFVSDSIEAILSTPSKKGE